ncbi:MAG: TAT-variant-translocated molybdopterin oxidoreductase [Bacteroidetes bacterium]|nr:TAT-variant-translocated molybdopterin oxidoreductase [Bacteroidota bacterium]
MKHGKEYWLSLRDRDDTDAYRSLVEREFPEGTMQLASSMNRRTFLTLMGASMALAGLTSCRRPEEDIVPYVSLPEEITPGNILRYATSMPLGTDNASLLVDTREGRPVKIAGNDRQPVTGSASSVWTAASILGLYDPDRSQQTTLDGEASTLAAFTEVWKSRYGTFVESGGKGLALLCQPFASPTLHRQMNTFRAAFPEAIVAVTDPVSDRAILDGNAIAFGRPLRPRYDFTQADIVLALDADLFGSEFDAVANARAFAARRRVSSTKDTMNRLYVVEPTLTQTAALADHRLRLSAGMVPACTAALARELRQKGLALPAVVDSLPVTDAVPSTWIEAVADDLLAHRGRAIVAAGRGQNPAVHALVALLNDTLGNTGKTIRYAAQPYAHEAETAGFTALADAMKAGSIETLFILGGNPVFDAPADMEFRTLLENIATSVHVGLYDDETGHACKWHIPLRHYLEAWGDVSSIHGHLGVVQPLIEPLYADGISDVELLQLLVTGAVEKGYDIVRKTWAEIVPGLDERSWRSILHDGLYPSAVQLETPPLNLASVAATMDTRSFVPLLPSRENMELVFRISPAVHDGRFANNGWLQEFPDPVTKLTWDNAALISRKTAEENGLTDGDLIRLSTGNHEAPMPVWIMPGQADNTITVTLGYGRRTAGRVGSGVGFNAYRLRRADAPFIDRGLRIGPAFARHALACVQDHHGLDTERMAREGVRERLPQLYREATVDEYAAHPDFAPERVELLPLRNQWEDHPYDTGHQWGMSIDLNACIGCGACTIACQSENNIPIVGKEQVLNGREMHWIRIDRYFKGEEEDPGMRVMPVACHHCEMAPCEQVCPVAATSHDEEGLNVMTYNRCIGTRYCSNNCPYKVRRFNFYNYTTDLPEVMKMAQNPDVSVRFRGVMEKCTYCTQRITRSKIDAKRDGRVLADGDIRAACEEACPTQAIIFGDINNPDSRVAKEKANERTYGMLAEYNLRPRTTYLARLTNPNTKLED